MKLEGLVADNTILHAALMEVVPLQPLGDSSAESRRLRMIKQTYDAAAVSIS